MVWKNVIFDFNGVLFWDSLLHEKIWKCYAEEIRGTTLSDEEVRSHFEGRTNKSCFEYLLHRNLSDTELKQRINEREKRYKKLCLTLKDEFVLSPGAITFLEWLNSSHIPHTIATSSEKSNVDFFFKHLNLNKWFKKEDVVYDDGIILGKPAPDMYLKAALKLSANPHDCLVVEDANSGIQSAVSAGIGVVVALGPKEKHKILQESQGVSFVITHLGELLPPDFHER